MFWFLHQKSAVFVHVSDHITGRIGKSKVPRPHLPIQGMLVLGQRLWWCSVSAWLWSGHQLDADEDEVSTTTAAGGACKYKKSIGMNLQTRALFSLLFGLTHG